MDSREKFEDWAEKETNIRNFLPHVDGGYYLERVEDLYQAFEAGCVQGTVVWLGNGDKLVADIYSEDGSWAGVGVFNPPNGVTGEIGESDGQIDGRPLAETLPILSIRSDKPESLQVVIDELREAQQRMGYTNQMSEVTPELLHWIRSTQRLMYSLGEMSGWQEAADEVDRILLGEE